MTMQFGKSCISLDNTSLQQPPLIPHSKLITDKGPLLRGWAAKEILFLIWEGVLQSDQDRMSTERARVNKIS